MMTLFNWQQFFSAFVVLFAIIDITGSIPVILALKKKGRKISPLRAALISLVMFVVFFFIGDALLQLFHVDISSFAVAGSLIIFIVALEMILDIEIFRYNDEAGKDATFVPVVFPLVAGAGALTTLLSIRSQYDTVNILLAVAANMIIVYLVIRLAKQLEHLLGPGVIYMLQKFFGIILLAVSVKLFTTNITFLIEEIK